MLHANLKSFAKINIGLRVLQKRSDGFHDIETIFYPVKLHDEIKISIEPASGEFNSVILKSNRYHIPLNRENLCYRAIEKFFNIFKIKDKFIISIYLKKLIPVGGGLGGGSSNAASIIKFLIKFFKMEVEPNRKKILELALGIGSDVPFFLTMKPCYAEGRGEQLQMLPDFHLDYLILIVNPNLHISTKWAFEKLSFDGRRQTPALNSVKRFDLPNANIFVNDFEQVVFEKFEILKELKADLQKHGALYSSLSGSGATMFGLFEKGKENVNQIHNSRDFFSRKGFFTYISD